MVIAAVALSQQTLQLSLLLLQVFYCQISFKLFYVYLQFQASQTFALGVSGFPKFLGIELLQLFFQHYSYSSSLCRLSDYSSEVWIYHCQTYPKGYRNMFRVEPRATLGLIFFTVLILKSEKQWKVLSGCLKNLPSGISQGKFFQTTTADFPLFILVFSHRMPNNP